jgi:hypothetical protein
VDSGIISRYFGGYIPEDSIFRDIVVRSSTATNFLPLIMRPKQEAVYRSMHAGLSH